MLDGMTDRELLAVLVGKRAEKAQYLDLAELAGAGESELRIIFGARGAERLAAALELGRRATTSRPARGRRITCAADAWSHYRARLSCAPVEEFWTIALDVRHRVQDESMVARGSLTGVEVHPRDVFRPLIRMSAAAAIFVHNHPSGDHTPSRQDLDLTARLREVGTLTGIAVLDHVIVAHEGYCSLSDRGWQ
jgi:DNA repair protein RadC